MRICLFALVWTLTACQLFCGVSVGPKDVIASVSLKANKGKYDLFFKFPDRGEFIFYMPAGDVDAMGLDDHGYSKNVARIKIVTTIFQGEKTIAIYTLDSRKKTGELSAIYGFPPNAEGGFFWASMAAFATSLQPNEKGWVFFGSDPKRGLFKPGIEYHAVVQIEGDRAALMKTFGVDKIQIVRRFFH